MAAKGLVNCGLVRALELLAVPPEPLLVQFLAPGRCPFSKLAAVVVGTRCPQKGRRGAGGRGNTNPHREALFRAPAEQAGGGHLDIPEPDGKRITDRGFVARNDHEVERSHGLTEATDFARHRGFFDPLDTAEHDGQLFGTAPRHVDQPPLTRRAGEADGIDQLLLSRGPEAGQLDEPILATGVLELAQTLQTQVLPQRAHLLGTEPGDPEHLADTRRDRLLRLLQNRGLSAVHQLLENRRRALAHSLDLEDLTAHHHLREVTLDPFHRSRGIGQRAHPVDVFALQLEKGGDLPEGPSGGFAIKVHLSSKHNKSSIIPSAFKPFGAPS